MYSFTLVLVAVCFAVHEVTSDPNTLCFPENQTCNANDDCCSGICDMEVCTKLVEVDTICSPLSAKCQYPDDCCSTVCFRNQCVPTIFVPYEYDDSDED